ncbi:hypothetical protein [Levilinea saccharolytica]|uniref:Uncharacterized protein n=2 Tax=Levilinea saccharolytica TaxID=229921 RepID=A0A0P6Y0Z7_9CHLR|nr:hypothetical protein [Levilinea saccharolytica]KPL91108.1 hypothetical protein ADN01_01710 [Levilinea saccharolytica]
MMATVGVDCDVALFHAAVQGGEALGLIVEPRPRSGPAISLHFEAYPDALGQLQAVQHIWFTVLLADDLRNPDGTPHAVSAAEMRAGLYACLNQHAEIGLVTRLGTFTGLRSSGHILIENVYPGFSTALVQLSSDGGSFQPIPYAVYADSLWVDEALYHGARTWDNSYWRS